MIYTVTFNPSLDYMIHVPDFSLGKTNRTHAERILPGGKGVNVSIVLNRLDQENTALGFSAGFTGAEIERRLDEMGIHTDFIPIEWSNNRINIKIQNVEGTEINGMGPSIPSQKIEALMQKLDHLTAGDVLVLAGSIPPSIPDGIYCEIMHRLGGKNVRTVVDATQNLLCNVLPHRPFLIKPNHHELGELFGVTLESKESVIPFAKELQDLGARNVLVSMAGEGAVLVAENGCVYTANTPAGKLVNSVGAGDSMVAGFLAGWLESGSYETAFYMGVAAGSASAYTEEFASKAEIMQLYQEINCGICE